MFLALLGLSDAAGFFAQVSDGKVVSPPYTSFLFWILAMLGLFLSISIHEFAHAYSAYKLGDSTAKLNDRMTLNPFKHFDMFGFILILFTQFGYGKPVPVNPNNFKNPIQGMMYVSLAGPVSNIAIAIFLGILFGALKALPVGENFLTTLIYSLPYIGLFNIGLAVFNLLPFHPLDGSKIWGYIHYRIAEFIYAIQPYSIFILILIIYPIFNGLSIIGLILDPLQMVYFNIIGYS